MNILLFGNQGQLGWELQRTLPTLGEVVSLDYPRIDLVQPESIRHVIHDLMMTRKFPPDILINATAYTAVDQAEDERQKAFAINALAPAIMAEEASRLNAAFIHYSTDYVFDGQLGKAYLESDQPNPMNVYGESKLAGEQSIVSIMETSNPSNWNAYLILRTSWVYSLRGNSFVNKVLRWSRQQKKLRLVTDQVGNPTWARFLAETTAQLLAMAKNQKDPIGWLSERKGLYHLAGDGWASRYEWGKYILTLDPHPEEHLVETLEPALTYEFPSPARRPPFSALDCSHFISMFNLRLPDWKEALSLALNHSPDIHTSTNG